MHRFRSIAQNIATVLTCKLEKRMPRLVHMVSTLLIVMARMLVLMVLCGKKQADEDTSD